MIVELLVIKSVAIMTMYNALVMSTIDYYDNRRLQRKLHTVSYTHLDVYKRQGLSRCSLFQRLSL